MGQLVFLFNLYLTKLWAPTAPNWVGNYGPPLWKIVRKGTSLNLLEMSGWKLIRIVGKLAYFTYLRDVFTTYLYRGYNSPSDPKYHFGTSQAQTNPSRNREFPPRRSQG